MTRPFDPLGYAVSENIGIQVTFSEAVMVSGRPLLKLGIGAGFVDAEWDEDASAGAFVMFRYVVTLEDRDEDGVSIGADALHAVDGAIHNADGVEAELSIGDHAIFNADDQLVLGAPSERGCGDERFLALRYARTAVGDWDGTPFRVDIMNNFPDFVPDAYLQGELDAIGELADQIEAQLGYRIVERDDLSDVPAGAPEGWDQDFDQYWRNDLLPRAPGQLLAFYINEDNSAWDGAGSPMSAHVCCGTTSYNRRYFQAPHWTEWTGPNSPDGRAIVHELFHLIGFIHVREDSPVGIPMSLGGLHLPWETGSPTYYATSTDIENLRCIFPEGG